MSVETCVLMYSQRPQVFALCAEAYSAALGRHGLDQTFECCYVCESDKQKWPWLHEVMDKLLDEDCCHSPDATVLGSRACMCVRHNQPCDVRPTEGIVAGVSCKYFSRMNRYARGAGSVLSSYTSPGKARI